MKLRLPENKKALAPVSPSAHEADQRGIVFPGAYFSAEKLMASWKCSDKTAVVLTR
jgi:hypothetical protein